MEIDEKFVCIRTDDDTNITINKVYSLCYVGKSCVSIYDDVNVYSFDVIKHSEYKMYDRYFDYFFIGLKELRKKKLESIYESG